MRSGDGQPPLIAVGRVPPQGQGHHLADAIHPEAVQVALVGQPAQVDPRGARVDVQRRRRQQPLGRAQRPRQTHFVHVVAQLPSLA